MNLLIFKIAIFSIFAITTQTATAYSYTVQLGCVLQAEINQDPLAAYKAVKAEFQSGHYVLEDRSVYADALRLCNQRADSQVVGLKAHSIGYLFNGVNYPVRPPETLDDFVVIDFSLIQPLAAAARADYMNLLERASGFIDNRAYDQIYVDVVRTHNAARPAFFRNSEMAKSLTRVLFTFNQKYPKVGYSQGYNDIAAQLFVHVFDSFHKNKARPLNSKLRGELEGAEAHWVFNSYPGTQSLSDEQVIEVMSFEEKIDLEANVFASLSRIFSPYLKATNAGRDSTHLMLMNELVPRILEKSDPELLCHLNQVIGGKMDIGSLLTGWNTYFLAREIPSEALSLLWNSYLTDEATAGFVLLHPYVSAALIISMRDKLLRLNPEDDAGFPQLLDLFNRPIDGLTVEVVKNVISHAKRLRAVNADLVASYAKRLGVRVDALKEGVLDNGHVTIHAPVNIVDDYR